MRFHVASLPHTSTTREFSWCAYTEKVRKFATMMTRRGHTVYLYDSGVTDAECEESVAVVKPPADASVTEPEWTEQYWAPMNHRAIAAIAERIERRDFICIIGGNCQQVIAQAFPNHMSVEFGIGYEGTFSPYRVFESYAWMHTVYGAQQGALGSNGKFYDEVIPNYFEVEQFPSGIGGNYLLYVGRLIKRKGVEIAVETAKRTGMKLILAGQGDSPPHGEHVGVVGPERRAELMGGARALLCPTIYVEPFGGVAVEAQMCGTPVITTDWGAFTETVEQGVSGFRCRTMEQFTAAARAAGDLDREFIRARAIDLYSTGVIARQYEEYFTRLLGLFEDGFLAYGPDDVRES
jgi:glycosyltransferase involved in cell wall biosynthesis